jgi:hypothetical protein
MGIVVWLIGMIIFLTLPQVGLSIYFMDQTGNFYACGFVLGMMFQAFVKHFFPD